MDDEIEVKSAEDQILSLVDYQPKPMYMNNQFSNGTALQVAHAFGCHPRSFNGCILSHEGDSFFFCVGSHIGLYNKTHNDISFVPGRDPRGKEITAMCVSKDGRYLAVAERFVYDMDGIMSIPQSEEITHKKDQSNSICSVIVIDLTTGEKGKTMSFPSKAAPIVDMTFTHDSVNLLTLSGGPDHILTYWRRENSKPLATKEIGAACFRVINHSSDRNCFSVCGPLFVRNFEFSAHNKLIVDRGTPYALTESRTKSDGSIRPLITSMCWITATTSATTTSSSNQQPHAGDNTLSKSKKDDLCVVITLDGKIRVFCDSRLIQIIDTQTLAEARRETELQRDNTEAEALLTEKSMRAGHDSLYEIVMKAKSLSEKAKDMNGDNENMKRNGSNALIAAAAAAAAAGVSGDEILRRESIGRSDHEEELGLNFDGTSSKGLQTHGLKNGILSGKKREVPSSMRGITSSKLQLLTCSPWSRGIVVTGNQGYMAVFKTSTVQQVLASEAAASLSANPFLKKSTNTANRQRRINMALNLNEDNGNNLKGKNKENLNSNVDTEQLGLEKDSIIGPEGTPISAQTPQLELVGQFSLPEGLSSAQEDRENHLGVGRRKIIKEISVSMSTDSVFLSVECDTDVPGHMIPEDVSILPTTSIERLRDCTRTGKSSQPSESASLPANVRNLLHAGPMYAMSSVQNGGIGKSTSFDRTAAVASLTSNAKIVEITSQNENEDEVQKLEPIMYSTPADLLGLQIPRGRRLQIWTCALNHADLAYANDQKDFFSPISTDGWHDAPIISLSTAKGRRQFATVSTDRTLRIWQYPTSITDPHLGLAAMGFGAESTSKSTSDNKADDSISRRLSGSAELEDSYRCLVTIRLSEFEDPLDVAIHPEGTQVALCLTDSVRLLRPCPNRTSQHADIRLRHPTKVVYSPNGCLLAVASDGAVTIIDAISGNALVSHHAHHGFTTCMAFSADSKIIFSAGSDGAVFGWDTSNSFKRTFELVEKGEIFSSIVHVLHMDAIILSTTSGRIIALAANGLTVLVDANMTLTDEAPHASTIREAYKSASLQRLTSLSILGFKNKAMIAPSNSNPEDNTAGVSERRGSIMSLDGKLSQQQESVLQKQMAQDLDFMKDGNGVISTLPKEINPFATCLVFSRPLETIFAGTNLGTIRCYTCPLEIDQSYDSSIIKSMESSSNSPSAAATRVKQNSEPPCREFGVHSAMVSALDITCENTKLISVCVQGTIVISSLVRVRGSFNLSSQPQVLQQLNVDYSLQNLAGLAIWKVAEYAEVLKNAQILKETLDKAEQEQGLTSSATGTANNNNTTSVYMSSVQQNANTQLALSLASSGINLGGATNLVAQQLSAVGSPSTMSKNGNAISSLAHEVRKIISLALLCVPREAIEIIERRGKLVASMAEQAAITGGGNANNPMSPKGGLNSASNFASSLLNAPAAFRKTASTWVEAQADRRLAFQKKIDNACRVSNCSLSMDGYVVVRQHVVANMHSKISDQKEQISHAADEAAYQMTQQTKKHQNLLVELDLDRQREREELQASINEQAKQLNDTYEKHAEEMNAINGHHQELVLQLESQFMKKISVAQSRFLSTAEQKDRDQILHEQQIAANQSKHADEITNLHKQHAQILRRVQQEYDRLAALLKLDGLRFEEALKQQEEEHEIEVKQRDNLNQQLQEQEASRTAESSKQSLAMRQSMSMLSAKLAAAELQIERLKTERDGLSKQLVSERDHASRLTNRLKEREAILKEKATNLTEVREQLQHYSAFRAVLFQKVSALEADKEPSLRHIAELRETVQKMYGEFLTAAQDRLKQDQRLRDAESSLASALTEVSHLRSTGQQSCVELERAAAVIEDAIYSPLVSAGNAGGMGQTAGGADTIGHSQFASDAMKPPTFGSLENALSMEKGMGDERGASITLKKKLHLALKRITSFLSEQRSAQADGHKKNRKKNRKIDAKRGFDFSKSPSDSQLPLADTVSPNAKGWTSSSKVLQDTAEQNGSSPKGIHDISSSEDEGNSNSLASNGQNSADSTSASVLRRLREDSRQLRGALEEVTRQRDVLAAKAAAAHATTKQILKDRRSNVNTLTSENAKLVEYLNNIRNTSTSADRAADNYRAKCRLLRMFVENSILKNRGLNQQAKSHSNPNRAQEIQALLSRATVVMRHTDSTEDPTAEERQQLINDQHIPIENEAHDVAGAESGSQLSIGDSKPNNTDHRSKKGGLLQKEQEDRPSQGSSGIHASLIMKAKSHNSSQLLPFQRREIAREHDAHAREMKIKYPLGSLSKADDRVGLSSSGTAGMKKEATDVQSNVSKHFSSARTLPPLLSTVSITSNGSMSADGNVYISEEGLGGAAFSKQYLKRQASRMMTPIDKNVSDSLEQAVRSAVEQVMHVQPTLLTSTNHQEGATIVKKGEHYNNNNAKKNDDLAAKSTWEGVSMSQLPSIVLSGGELSNENVLGGEELTSTILKDTSGSSEQEKPTSK